MKLLFRDLILSNIFKSDANPIPPKKINKGIAKFIIPLPLKSSKLSVNNANPALQNADTE